jgi:nickel/cobalt exporter
LTFRVFGRRLAGAVLGLLALTLPAMAHPHILIDAKVTVVFNDAGEVIGLKNDWTFDKLFSTWVIQGLDTDGDRETSVEELQPLADDNMNGLAEYGFYTFAGSGDDLMQFTPVGDQKMVYADERVTLSYSRRPRRRDRWGRSSSWASMTRNITWPSALPMLRM